jgi:hypothetical protein
MRYPLIDPDLFKRNRRKLIGGLEKDSLAILHSNDQMVRSGDQYYPYRQSSDLFYLTGIEQEMTVLMISPGADEPSRLFNWKPGRAGSWTGILLPGFPVSLPFTGWKILKSRCKS